MRDYFCDYPDGRRVFVADMTDAELQDTLEGLINGIDEVQGLQATREDIIERIRIEQVARTLI